MAVCALGMAVGAATLVAAAGKEHRSDALTLASAPGLDSQVLTRSLVVGERRGAIDVVRVGDAGRAQVVGWVDTVSAEAVTLRSGGHGVPAMLAGERHDLAAATSTRGRRGFHAELVGTGPTVCLLLGDAVADCAWVGCDPGVFSDRFRRRLAREAGSARVTASVIDLRTGCEYGIDEEVLITTASVIKVQVLAALLLEAGAQQRALTPREVSLVDGMIQRSLNPETGVLWAAAGGVTGLDRVDRRLGATSTAHTSAFGATVSTARDRSVVSLAVLGGGGALGWPQVELARHFLAGVTRAQQWGISAGVASGHPVWLKNGFFPLRGRGWRVGSTGFVADPDGEGYAFTVLTDQNLDQAGGIELVELVARHVNRRLTAGADQVRPYDEVRCLTADRSGGSWTGWARALGLPASAAEEVRRSAGGDGPMRGQSICTP